MELDGISCLFLDELPKLTIELHQWSYDCADGCCTNYGTTTKVNGVEMPSQNEDAATILHEVLTHLGYNVEIKQTYSND